MLNPVSVEAFNEQERIQAYAAQAALTCKHNQTILQSDVVIRAALTALGILATCWTATLSLTVALPIVLGVCTLGLLAYTVNDIRDRVLLKKLSIQYEPIFQDILDANYASALSKLNELMPMTDNKPDYSAAEVMQSKFYVRDYRWTQPITFYYLQSTVVVLNALTEMSNGIIKTPNDRKNLHEEYALWGAATRCGGTRISNWDELIRRYEALPFAEKKFKAQPIRSWSQVLLTDFARALQHVEATFQSDDPREWGRGSWSGIAESIKFFKLLLQLDQKLDPTSKKHIEAIIECKTLKEMWEYVSDSILKATEN